MSNERQHFIVPYRLDDQDRFLIWFSGERDGVLLTETGAVVTFANETAAAAFAQAQGLSIELDAGGCWNFDAIARWIERPASDTIDCNAFYDVWNLLGDIADSNGTLLDFSDDERHVHGKLFWGCNVPAVTPPSEHFVPEWHEDQIRTLTNALNGALQRARDSIAA
jgi:hypothetical protein